MPKLLITQATGYRFRGSLEPYKLRKRKLVGAIIPYLAALAPQDWKITLVDDATEEIDFNADVDVVAITIRTVTSLRGYEIADKFRRRGVTVIMGGPHATFYSDEVAEHADAVCIGEAEEIFPRMLEDAAAGRLRSFTAETRPRTWRGCRHRAGTCSTRRNTFSTGRMSSSTPAGARSSAISAPSGG